MMRERSLRLLMVSSESTPHRPFSSMACRSRSARRSDTSAARARLATEMLLRLPAIRR